MTIPVDVTAVKLNKHKVNLTVSWNSDDHLKNDENGWSFELTVDGYKWVGSNFHYPQDAYQAALVELDEILNETGPAV